ncbi:xylose isomerase [Flavobacterium piscis]|uniref:xylose isomerase n=1 Tax=Flavobacterium piscis TaxID=1114874 RepID=A0ABU1YDH4_9FLAO|nr:xylose isomerase [Flavobacterium piscis]
MGFDYFCFHDYDLIAEGPTFAESERRLATITEYLKEKKAASGIKLLWGTSNSFSSPYWWC